MMRTLVLTALASCLIAFGCAQQPETAPSPEVAPTAMPSSADHSPVVVPEAFLTAFDHADNVDSVAPSATHGLVAATTKGTHQLLVYDAATGETLRRVGEPGAGPGQFQRPNGIAIRGDLVFVVERDNHRIQVLRLPEFESVGLIGAEELERPYGIDLHQSASGVWEAYVTDYFELDEDPSAVERLNERVKHFRITDSGDAVTGELVKTFGDLEGPGALMKVETLMLDPAANRILIAEETDETMRFKIYGLDGTYTGRDVDDGLFTAEPEGLALWTCGEDGGYWIATDQHKDFSVFHVLNRGDFSLVGSFIGETVANTDGVGLTREPTDRFPEGAFYAVHDDQGMGGWDLRDIATAVGLDSVCP
jgi:3-phytase